MLRVPEAAAFRPRPPPLWTASDAIRQITRVALYESLRLVGSRTSHRTKRENRAIHFITIAANVRLASPCRLRPRKATEMTAAFVSCLLPIDSRCQTTVILQCTIAQTSSSVSM